MYRGYYIDHVYFNSEADIDAFIREKSIKAYATACELFARHPSIEASLYCDKLAQHLNKVEGLSWTEIEEIEITAVA